MILNTENNSLTLSSILSEHNFNNININLKKHCNNNSDNSFNKGLSPSKPIEKLEKNIYKKYIKNEYCISNEFYNKLLISHIIHNDNSHIVAEFKDYLIMGDYNEFIQKFYPLKSSRELLPKIFEYYESCSIIFPNYVAIHESKYIYKNIQKKQRVIDIIQEQEDKEEGIKMGVIKPDETESSIFNTLEIESILNQTNTSGVRKYIGLSNAPKLSKEIEVKEVENLILKIEKAEEGNLSTDFLDDLLEEENDRELISKKLRGKNVLVNQNRKKKYMWSGKDQCMTYVKENKSHNSNVHFKTKNFSKNTETLYNKIKQLSKRSNVSSSLLFNLNKKKESDCLTVKNKASKEELNFINKKFIITSSDILKVGIKEEGVKENQRHNSHKQINKKVTSHNKGRNSHNQKSNILGITYTNTFGSTYNNTYKSSKYSLPMNSARNMTNNILKTKREGNKRDVINTYKIPSGHHQKHGSVTKREDAQEIKRNIINGLLAKYKKIKGKNLDAVCSGKKINNENISRILSKKINNRNNGGEVSKKKIYEKKKMLNQLKNTKEMYGLITDRPAQKTTNNNISNSKSSNKKLYNKISTYTISQKILKNDIPLSARGTKHVENIHLKLNDFVGRNNDKKTICKNNKSLFKKGKNSFSKNSFSSSNAKSINKKSFNTNSRPNTSRNNNKILIPKINCTVINNYINSNHHNNNLSNNNVKEFGRLLQVIDNYNRDISKFNYDYMYNSKKCSKNSGNFSGKENYTYNLNNNFKYNKYEEDEDIDDSLSLSNITLYNKKLYSKLKGGELNNLQSNNINSPNTFRERKKLTMKNINTQNNKQNKNRNESKESCKLNNLDGLKMTGNNNNRKIKGIKGIHINGFDQLINNKYNNECSNSRKKTFGFAFN